MALDPFTVSFLEAALWATHDPDRGDAFLDARFSIHDVAPETLARIAADCARFQEQNAALIGDRDVRAGHDFLLTRNRHGAGFWDGDWPKEAGKALTDAAHAFGELQLYPGDDGRLHA